MQAELLNLNQKRLSFIEQTKKRGLIPAKALYAQQNGGFTGIGISERSGRILLISGPGPLDTDENYHIEEAPLGELFVEEFYVESEGFHGLFGFGKKGGKGFKLHYEYPSGTHTLVIRPDVTCIADVQQNKDMVFLPGRKKSFNPVWNMQPTKLQTCKTIIDKWQRLILR